MVEDKETSEVFSSREIELTKKYFGLYLDEVTALIISIFNKCNIPNINRDDCEDMYNEFFTLAAQTYNPKKSKFLFYLKRIVEYKTYTLVRRVIQMSDPLFYAVSLDHVMDNGAPLAEVIGDNDVYLEKLINEMESPEAEHFNLSPLDQLIIYYRGCGYTLREIGGMLNLSVSTVQRRLVSQRKNTKLLKSLNKLD